MLDSKKNVYRFIYNNRVLKFFSTEFSTISPACTHPDICTEEVNTKHRRQPQSKHTEHEELNH